MNHIIQETPQISDCGCTNENECNCKLSLSDQSVFHSIDADTIMRDTFTLSSEIDQNDVKNPQNFRICTTEASSVKVKQNSENLNLAEYQTENSKLDEDDNINYEQICRVGDIEDKLELDSDQASNQQIDDNSSQSESLNARIDSERSDSSSDSLNQRVGSEESSEFVSSQAIISRLLDQPSPERETITVRDILNNSEMSHFGDVIPTDTSSDIVVEYPDQSEEEISDQSQEENSNEEEKTDGGTNTDKSLSILNVSDQNDIENADQPSFEESMQNSEQSIKIDDVLKHSFEESDQSSSSCIQKFDKTTKSNEQNKNSFGPHEEQKGESLKMDTSDCQTTNKQFKDNSENILFDQKCTIFSDKNRLPLQNRTSLIPNGNIDPNKIARSASQMYPIHNSSIVEKNMQPNRCLHNAFSYPLEESKSFYKNGPSSSSSSKRSTTSKNVLKHKNFNNTANPQAELSAISGQIKNLLLKMDKIVNMSKNGNNQAFDYIPNVSNSRLNISTNNKFNYNSTNDLLGANKKIKKHFKKSKQCTTLSSKTIPKPPKSQTNKQIKISNKTHNMSRKQFHNFVEEDDMDLVLRSVANENLLQKLCLSYARPNKLSATNIKKRQSSASKFKRGKNSKFRKNIEINVNIEIS